MFSTISHLYPFAIWFCFVSSSIVAGERSVIDHLQEISVTIRSGYSSGSGVLFTREDRGHTRTFVFTAAHVCDDLRKEREVIVKGVKKTVVEFGDAAIVREYTQNGRRVGETKLDARIVRYSDADSGEDLCLLEVRQRDFAPESVSVEFYNGEHPPIGTELFHVGSLLGQTGANSLTSGVVSQIGRVLDLGANGRVFTQSTCTAFPGSSGGGVFLKSDGRCIGLLVRGSGEQFNFLVGFQRIREWAKRADIEWAVDKNISLPTDEELSKLPIEDASATGVEPNREGTTVEFPFLIKR